MTKLPLHSVVSLLLFAVPMLHAQQDTQVGYQTPWVTYMAVDATTNGQALSSHAYGEIANEALSRSCVRLDSPGEYVRWIATNEANSIVVRHCIPDAPEGGGSTGLIGLWINSQFRQNLVLDSRHAWLYGESENPQSNDPAKGTAHRFFDEIRAFVSGAAIAPGDMVELRLENDEAGAPEWAVIDLIDLENVPPPGSKPEGYLSVVDYGAVPDDDTDDTSAIQAALEAAKQTGQGVWISVGDFRQSAPLLADGVIIQGAGPWHTSITPINTPADHKDFKGNCGFRLTGRGTQVRDLAINGLLTGRSEGKQHGFTGDPSNFVIENIWVEHTDTGAWLRCSNGLVRNCRFRDTYADGINLNNGSHDVILEQIHTRNTGDDGLAVFANPQGRGTDATCENIVLRHNIADSPWWAHCIGIYGGQNIHVENNLLRGSNRASGIVVSTEHKAWPGHDIVIAGNRIEDCGGVSWKQNWGAIWVYTPGNDLEDLSLRDNHIIRPVHEAIKIQGLSGTLNAALSGNRIEESNIINNALVITPGTHGSLLLESNDTPISPFIRNGADPAKLKLTTN